jgi:hypothetical protein
MTFSDDGANCEVSDIRVLLDETAEIAQEIVYVEANTG